jgi:hypothetical protein
MTTRPFPTEPRQIDLEEYIAEKTGTAPVQQRQQEAGDQRQYQTTTSMYRPLREVLHAAYTQAADGKGKDRHANGKPFLEQPIMEIGRMVGMGYQTGQAMKKAQEACGMLQRMQYEAARAELLGAINYLAAAYLLIGELSVKQDVDIEGDKGV